MNQLVYLSAKSDNLKVAFDESSLFVERDRGWHREDVQFASRLACTELNPIGAACGRFLLSTTLLDTGVTCWSLLAS